MWKKRESLSCTSFKDRREKFHKSSSVSLCSKGLNLPQGLGFGPSSWEVTLSPWVVLPDKNICLPGGFGPGQIVSADNVIYGGKLWAMVYQFDLWKGWRLRSAMGMVNHIFVTESQ